MKKILLLIALLSFPNAVYAFSLVSDCNPASGCALGWTASGGWVSGTFSTGGVSSFTGDGVIINNSSSTGAVTDTLVNAAANSVLGNNTGSGAPPAYQTSISISGTAATAAHTITSASATALIVGPNGSTNPVLTVNGSTASSASGISITGAAAGTAPTISTTTSSTNGAGLGLNITTKTATATGTGGPISIKPGASLTTAAGAGITIQAANGIGTNQAGGNIIITPGSSTSSTSQNGAILINGTTNPAWAVIQSTGNFSNSIYDAIVDGNFGYCLGNGSGPAIGCLYSNQGDSQGHIQLGTITASDRFGIMENNGNVQMSFGDNFGTSIGHFTTTPTTAPTNGLWVQGGVVLAGLSSDAGTTDSSVCKVTSTNALAIGSGTLGICLGTSSARYKNNIVDQVDGLAQITALKPKNFYYNAGHGDDGAKQQYGFMAEDVVSVLPKLVGLDKEGKPNTVDLLGMIPVLAKAMQEQQEEIEALQHGIPALHCKKLIFGLEYCQ